MMFILCFLLTISWNRNPDPAVVGYRVYWRTFDPSRLEMGGPWLISWDVGNTNQTRLATVDNLWYDYVVTCYTSGGVESDFSNENYCIYVRP